MFAVGISFMIMGSTHFIVTRVLKQEQPELAARIQKRIFYTGIWIIAFSIIGWFLHPPYNTIAPVLPVLFLCGFIIRIYRELLHTDHTKNPHL